MVPEGCRKHRNKSRKEEVSRIYKFMGIRALYPPPKTTILNKENKKFHIC
jgi:putative transposase